MESSVVDKPLKWAVSERGKPIQHTEAEVDAALRLLVANGGKPHVTAKQLTEEGLKISKDGLRLWRDQQFPHRYMQLRTEMGKEVAEKIAGSAMERAMEADAAEAEYIAKAVEKINEVDPNHLAKNALALANAKGQNIEKAQLLRGMPTENVKVDLAASIAVLERLQVVEPSEVIDGEAEVE